jgi:tRNA A-37 threonylcarbamoyl transferase component Bud32
MTGGPPDSLPSRPVLPVQAGDVLAGKYRVEHVLGAGGMGMVVAARHIALQDRVALKFLLPEHQRNPEVVARFRREAQAAVRIKSEHVARVLDVGTLDSGAPYIVMEFLEGVDLARRLADMGRLPIAEAVDDVLQACEAIAEAHALGIVHRDLKPANLFLTRRADGSALVKVLDFGISKSLAPLRDATSSDLTKTAGLVGSPLYMSPEQIRSSKGVGVRTDVWSLGVILFELVVGRPPFQGETPAAVLAAILTEAPAPLRAFLPDAGVLEAVIGRCLQRDVSMRWQSLTELARALAPLAPPSSQMSVDRIEAVLRASGVGATERAPAGGTSQRTSQGASQPRGAGTAVGWGQTAGAPAWHGRAALAAGVGSLAAVLVVGFAVIHGIVRFPDRRADSGSGETRAMDASDPASGMGRLASSLDAAPSSGDAAPSFRDVTPPVRDAAIDARPADAATRIPPFVGPNPNPNPNPQPPPPSFDDLTRDRK